MFVVTMTSSAVCSKTETMIFQLKCMLHSRWPLVRMDFTLPPVPMMMVRTNVYNKRCSFDMSYNWRYGCTWLWDSPVDSERWKLWDVGRWCGYTRDSDFNFDFTHSSHWSVSLIAAQLYIAAHNMVGVSSALKKTQAVMNLKSYLWLMKVVWP